MESRRKFIQKSCTACVGLVAFASVSTLLSSCASLPVYKAGIIDNIIEVPRTAILPDEKLKIIRTDKLNHDLLLIIKQDKQHYALPMKCSHQESSLIANKSNLVCNLHGSIFTLEGKVTNGPASVPLKKIKAIEENEIIKIYLT